ncbi:MAG: response regulator [Acidobacteriota bacterium]
MNPSRIDGTGQHILVIDDDLAIRVLLQAVLSRLHFEVTLAEDGLTGLETLKEGSFDLILLDLMMPRMNGYQFLQRMAEIYADGQRPHIIVFTAAGQRGVEKLPHDSACNSILKPFDLEKFTEMMEECLNGSHSRK